jgi:hypothetical protein
MPKLDRHQLFHNEDIELYNRLKKRNRVVGGKAPLDYETVVAKEKLANQRDESIKKLRKAQAPFKDGETKQTNLLGEVKEE